MRSYRASLVVTAYDARMPPEEVLVTAARSVAGSALAVEDSGLRMVGGVPALYVRFLSTSDGAAATTAREMAEAVRARATTGGLTLQRRDGGRWTPVRTPPGV